jgi:hypothetical protein
MSYDYKAHFGEVTLTQDLMSRPKDLVTAVQTIGR